MKRIIYSALVGLSILISVSSCTEEPIKPNANKVAPPASTGITGDVS